MRGTPHQTNKSISEPILMLGAEGPLVFIALSFWVMAFFGVFPHWPALVALIGLISHVFLLRLAASKDSQGCRVFKKNSRFLLQHRFYGGRGFFPVDDKCRKVVSVPLKLVRF